MKKISKDTIIHLLILIITSLILVFGITHFTNIYGSHIDWFKQHVVFPDYFRKLFYNTNNLLPNFSFHIGSGQNIFYLAYYGLFSPIILLSYLFPYISMINYIEITSILLVILSSLLCYYFIRINDYDKKIALFIALLFILSGSFIFHSHRHIMFVNYMPFLFLGLIGVKNYFDKNKSNLLIFSIALIILTSFYYSITGIICICIYALFYYLKTNNKINLKDLISFIIKISLGILLTSFLLLPLIYIIINSRDSESTKLLLTHFIPNINLKYILYDRYSIGLTSIILISLIYNLLFNKKEYKVLCISLLIIISIPSINLLLNGKLYLNGKVFIPLIPLFLILVASMIKDINFNIKRLIGTLIGLTACILFIDFNNYIVLFSIDITLTLILLIIYYKKKNIYYLFPILIIALSAFVNCNTNEEYVSIKEYKFRNKILSYDINNYIKTNNYRYQDDILNGNSINYSYAKNDYRTSIYSSTTNSNYLDSFYNSFNNNDLYRNRFMLNQTNNLFFNRYMGIRYLLTNNSPYGYKKIKEYNEEALYENTNVYPIIFTNNHILNKKQYNSLPFNYKLEAFNNNVIIDDLNYNPRIDFKSEKITLNYIKENEENLNITQEEDKYIIESKDNGKLKLKINNNLDNKSLIIRFKMNYKSKCSIGDTSITINGITNLLTCRNWKYKNENTIFDYVISSNNKIDTLDIEFTKGKYVISDIETYIIPNSFFDDKDITPVNITKIKDNYIYANVNQKKKGYLVFTIPYDKGFNIYIDNKKVDYYKVNDSFIGTPIDIGNHEIKLVFKAPFFTTGKIISIITLAYIIGYNIYIKKKRITSK